MVKTGRISAVNQAKRTAKVVIDGIDSVVTAELKIMYHEFENQTIIYPIYSPNDRVVVALTSGYNGVILGKID